MFIRFLLYQTCSLSHYILKYTLTQCHRLDYCKPLCAFWRPLKNGSKLAPGLFGPPAHKVARINGKMASASFLFFFHFSLSLCLYAFYACCAHTHIEKLFSHWRPQRAQKTMQPKIAFPAFSRLGLRAPFECVWLCVCVYLVYATRAQILPQSVICYVTSGLPRQNKNGTRKHVQRIGW